MGEGRRRGRKTNTLREMRRGKRPHWELDDNT